ncbi:MAG: type II toxin-antitoxin system HicB family antitoxin [Myxococcales bacterium]|nr:type II toxin-antitoxin system HicB family antitoxin [Myxococcales bacterium]
MSRPNYRVQLSFDGERKVFVARVPELPACHGEGTSRTEALVNMERELDALLANLGERGVRPPVAVDDETLSGELSLSLSKSLQRELLFAARAEGVEANQLVCELIAAGLEHRQRRAGRRPGSHESSGDSGSRFRSRDDDRPPNQEGGRFAGRPYDDGVRRSERNSAARLHGFLEDRASFMEYVRGVEAEGRMGHGRGGPGSGSSDRGRRPHAAGSGREDRRGPGGRGGGRPEGE